MTSDTINVYLPNVFLKLNEIDLDKTDTKFEELRPSIFMLRSQIMFEKKF